MSSDEAIGPAFPPKFRKENDEDSDSDKGCEYKANIFGHRLSTTFTFDSIHYNSVMILSGCIVLGN